MARIALTIAGAIGGALAAIFVPALGVMTWEGVAGWAAAGAGLGRVAGGVIDPARMYGPRLSDMAASSSANGIVVPFGYGTYRVPGNIIWSPGLVENTQNHSAKGGPVSTTYNYYASFAAAFGQGLGNIVRVWADSKVIFETGGPSYYPSHYFSSGSDGYAGGICGAFVDASGNLIKAVWFGHGFTATVPAGATALQLGINNNYQALSSGGFPVTVSVAGGQSTTAYIPATAVPWEVVGTQNEFYPFGNVGGSAPVLVLQNLTSGQSVTVAAVPDDNGTWGYQGRITLNASVGVNALGNSTGNTVTWFGPDGDTGAGLTGDNETAPPASIYRAPNCYPGSETQDVDPGIQANEGIGNTPAFRGLVYAVWDDFPLANFGNRIPTIRAEVSFQQNDTITTYPEIVQRAYLRDGDNNGTEVLTLDSTPIVGNTLLVLHTGFGKGGDAYAAIFHLAGFTLLKGQGDGDGGPAFQAAGIWSRIVQPGDGETFNFTVDQPGGGQNFAIYELAGQPTIDAEVGNADAGGIDLATGTISASGSTVVVGMFEVDQEIAIAGVAPSPYAATNAFTGGSSGNNHEALSFEGSGNPIASGAVTAYTGLDIAKVYATAAITASVQTGLELASTGLDSVVLDICLRSGLDADQVDVTRLADQQVIGYMVGRLCTGQQALQPLALAYFFDAAEINGVLVFVPRGQSSVMTIPEEDLGLKEDNAEYTESMGQEQDLPREVQVVYADPAIDYQPNKQGRRRSAKVVKTRGQSILELPLALDTDSAMQIAEKSLYLAYLERRPFSINLWKAVYSLLTPTDVIQFVGRGKTIQVRIVKTTEGESRTLAISAVSEAPSIYLSKATGGINSNFAGGTQATVVSVTLFVFDINLLRDSDANLAGTGYYFGLAAPSGFAGGVLDTSTDDANFNQESQSSAGMTYGTALNTLGAAGNGSPAGAFSPWVLDTANTIHVQLISGSLSSATLAQLTETGANALLVGSEVVQFETATQNMDGSWTLSNLLRGRRGTEGACATHGASETVVVLNVAGLVRVSQPNTILNLARYLRFVPFGQTVDAVTSTDFTDTGNDLKPWSPVAIGGSQDGASDWTISWLRRTRFGGAYGSGSGVLIDGVGGPLNEQSESYEIDIIGGSPVGVLRTLKVGTPSAVYTAAMQVTDFGSTQSTLLVKVYQISAVVGRGYVGEATLPLSTDAPVVLPDNGTFYIN